MISTLRSRQSRRRSSSSGVGSRTIEQTRGSPRVVDLRGPDEGTALEKEAVESAGVRYFNIPVTDRMLPTDFQIAEFARIVQDPKERSAPDSFGVG